MTVPVNVTNKTKRLSLVALAGAVLTVIFSVMDGYGWNAPPTVVAAITSLVLLLAGFWDWKHEESSVIYNGKHDGE